jgi:hypothetical protein
LTFCRRKNYSFCHPFLLPNYYIISQ